LIGSTIAQEGRSVEATAGGRSVGEKSKLL